MHFIHINSRWHTSKLEEIRILTLKIKAAVICVTETWLDDSVGDSEIEIKGYHAIRKERNRNGGVCLNIKTGFALNQRNYIHRETRSYLVWNTVT